MSEFKGHSPSVAAVQIYDTLREKPLEFIHTRPYINLSAKEGWVASKNGSFKYELLINLPEREFPVGIDYQPMVIIQDNVDPTCAPNNFPYAETVGENQVKLYAYEMPNKTNMLPIMLVMTQTGTPYGTTNVRPANRELDLGIEYRSIQLSQSYFILETKRNEEGEIVAAEDTEISFLVTGYKGTTQVPLEFPENISTPHPNAIDEADPTNPLKEILRIGRYYLLYNTNGTKVTGLAHNALTADLSNISASAKFNQGFQNLSGSDGKIAATIFIKEGTPVPKRSFYVQFDVTVEGQHFTARASILGSQDQSVVESAKAYTLTVSNEWSMEGSEYKVDGNFIDFNNPLQFSAVEIALNGSTTPLTGSSASIRFTDEEGIIPNSTFNMSSSITNLGFLNNRTSFNIELVVHGKMVAMQKIAIEQITDNYYLVTNVEQIRGNKEIGDNVFTAYVYRDTGPAGVFAATGSLTINEYENEDQLASSTPSKTVEISKESIYTHVLSSLGVQIYEIILNTPTANTYSKVLRVVEEAVYEEILFSFSPAVLSVETDAALNISSGANTEIEYRLYRNGIDISKDYTYTVSASQTNSDTLYTHSSANQTIAITKFGHSSISKIDFTVTATNKIHTNQKRYGMVSAVRVINPALDVSLNYYEAYSNSPDGNPMVLPSEVTDITEYKYKGFRYSDSLTPSTEPGDYIWITRSPELSIPDRTYIKYATGLDFDAEEEDSRAEVVTLQEFQILYNKKLEGTLEEGDTDPDLFIYKGELVTSNPALIDDLSAYVWREDVLEKLYFAYSTHGTDTYEDILVGENGEQEIVSVNIRESLTSDEYHLLNTTAKEKYEFLGILNSNSFEQSRDFNAYTWAKIKGEEGSIGKTGLSGREVNITGPSVLRIWQKNNNPMPETYTLKYNLRSLLDKEIVSVNWFKGGEDATSVLGFTIDEEDFSLSIDLAASTVLAESVINLSIEAMVEDDPQIYRDYFTTYFLYNQPYIFTAFLEAANGADFLTFQRDKFNNIIDGTLRSAYWGGNKINEVFLNVYQGIKKLKYRADVSEEFPLNNGEFSIKSAAVVGAALESLVLVTNEDDETEVKYQFKDIEDFEGRLEVTVETVDPSGNIEELTTSIFWTTELILEEKPFGKLSISSNYAAVSFQAISLEDMEDGFDLISGNNTNNYKTAIKDKLIDSLGSSSLLEIVSSSVGTNMKGYFYSTDFGMSYTPIIRDHIVTDNLIGIENQTIEVYEGELYNISSLVDLEESCLVLVDIYGEEYDIPLIDDRYTYIRIPKNFTRIKVTDAANEAFWDSIAIYRSNGEIFNQDGIPLIDNRLREGFYAFNPSETNFIEERIFYKNNPLTWTNDFVIETDFLDNRRQILKIPFSFLLEETEFDNRFDELTLMVRGINNEEERINIRRDFLPYNSLEVSREFINNLKDSDTITYQNFVVLEKILNEAIGESESLKTEAEIEEVIAVPEYAVYNEVSSFSRDNLVLEGAPLTDEEILEPPLYSDHTLFSTWIRKDQSALIEFDIIVEHSSMINIADFALEVKEIYGDNSTRKAKYVSFLAGDYHRAYTIEGSVAHAALFYFDGLTTESERNQAFSEIGESINIGEFTLSDEINDEFRFLYFDFKRLDNIADSVRISNFEVKLYTPARESVETSLVDRNGELAVLISQMEASATALNTLVQNAKEAKDNEDINFDFVPNLDDILAEYEELLLRIEQVRLEINLQKAIINHENRLQIINKNNSFSVGYYNKNQFVSGLQLDPVNGMLFKDSKIQIIGSTSIGSLYGKKIVLGRGPTDEDLLEDSDRTNSGLGHLAIWGSSEKWSSRLDEHGHLFYRYKDFGDETRLSGYMIMNENQIAAYDILKWNDSADRLLGNENTPPLLNDIIQRTTRELIFEITEEGEVFAGYLKVGTSKNPSSDAVFFEKLILLPYDLGEATESRLDLRGNSTNYPRRGVVFIEDKQGGDI